jgi:hypothetical protein
VLIFGRQDEDLIGTQQNKMKRNLNVRNVASYKALVVHNQSIKQIQRFDWIIQNISEP